MISVLVPVRERPDPLDRLYRETSEVLASAGIEAEFVFSAAEGSGGALAVLRPLAAAGAPLRLVTTTHPVDDATLLRLAAQEARADVLLLLPAYARIRPEALPGVLAALTDGVDLVAAARRPGGGESGINRLQRRLFHAMLPPTGTPLHDLGCGVVALRRAVLDRVPLYGDLLRFLPLLAERDGLAVVEVSAPQDPRDLGARVYGPGTYARRLLDLMDVYFLVRFTDKPLRFFGLIGSLLGIAGAVVLALLFVQKLQGHGIANRPLLLLGLLLLVVGIQVVALGLVAEIIVFLHVADRPTYRVRPPR
jgi:hypothetical protein